MYKPDRVILRKIKAYCPHLFVEWNERKQYFEIWIRMPVGRKLVTPVTRSIYEENGSDLSYTPLDERIIKWLYASDPAHVDDVKRAFDRWTQNYIEEERKKDKALRSQFRDMAMDMWGAMNHFYATKHAKKNGPPTFETKKPKQHWIAPDVRSVRSPRLFYRSAANARAYGRFK